MRLLLDEHLGSALAIALRRSGHDVETVAERPELRGLGDPGILAAAISANRVLVTANARDLVPIAWDVLLRGQHHGGLLAMSDRQFSFAAGATGALVHAIEHLFASLESADALGDQTVWLERSQE